MSNQREFMRDHLVNNISITRPLGTLVTKQSAVFPLLFYDPNSPLSPLVPPDSKQTKEKAVFRFSFCPSAQFYYCGGREEEGAAGGGVSCLQLPLPSWCPIQHRGSGSTTVSTLAHGCEENHMLSPLCWQTLKEQQNMCWPIFYWRPIIKKLFVTL